MHTLDSLLHFLLISGMVVPGLPPIGVGRNIGDVMNDDEGMAWARETGKSMAWLLRSDENIRIPSKKPKKH